ncbi:MAG: hypothetical protein AB7H96_16335 [Vicinamibacterales bacterium]
MSLKNVHVAFVVAAALLVLFCGLQAVGSFREGGSVLMAAAALVSGLGVIALVRYEIAFLRRCREAGIR